MRYVLAGSMLLRADWRTRDRPNTVRILPTDIVPLDGDLKVLIRGPYWACIGNDLLPDDESMMGLAVAGAWEDCYPVFKFACALRGCNLL